MKRALILGLGRFGGGREATRFLLRRGLRVRVADRAPASELRDEVAALEQHDEIEWRLGCESSDLLDDIELVVINPAVANDHPLLAAARERGLPCTQEVSLFLEHFPGKVVLVTGTNGKSTTATLLAAALRKAGLTTLLGGNLGHSLLADEQQWHKDTVAVLEISSFQLERLDPERNPVHGTVFTRVTSDHLDRHGSLAAYQRAKSVAAAAASAFVIHHADDAVARGFTTSARARVTYAQNPPAPGQVGCEGEWMVSALADAGRVLHRSAMQLPGAFQVDNAMAAFAAAALLGADRQRAAAALAEQRPLPYRLQRWAVHDGVELYDNSVSTELQSTLSALESLSPPLHWVGGGKSKDGDFAATARAISPHISSAHVFGDAAAPLAELLRGRCTVTSHISLEHALDAAWHRARAGHRILFSPAFASFDQFANFRARAAAFHAWVAGLASHEAGC